MDMNIARFVVFVFAVVGVIIWSIWIWLNLDKWRFAVAPLTYFLHVIVFNLAAQSQLFDPQIFNYWSTGIRLHSIIIFIGIGILSLKWRKAWTYK